MKKNGFVSTSLIYTFFILFLLLMIFLLNSYSSTRFLLDRFKYDIKNSFADEGFADINLQFLVWNDLTGEYELQKEIPGFGYYFEPEYSYCKNGSNMTYSNGNVTVSAVRKDICYAYFRTAQKDVVLKIYTKETSNSARVLVNKVPNFSYNLTKAKCDNSNATIKFDEERRRFIVDAKEKTVCEAEFTKIEMDILLNIYKEDVYGKYEYDGLKYSKVYNIPGLNYIFSGYTCTNKNVNTIIEWDEESNNFLITSPGKNECNVYFNGGSSKVEIILMQETDSGVSGYTTGLKYTKTLTVPGKGYRYVGYICDNPNAVVTFNNGIFETYIDSLDNIQAVCRAYFNRTNGNVHINYFLETSDGKYENVSIVPSLGYIYNSEKSYCSNNSKIIVDNTIVTIEAMSGQEDTCYVYFDMTLEDIKVNVYVMNKSTGKYELSDVPVSGYELYSAGCTNGASIEYVNGALRVMAESPTVCDVYFW